MRVFLKRLILLYRNISFLFPSQCKHYPTCSKYAEQALDKYSAFYASKKIFLRILKCNPWSKGGVDLP